MENLIVTMVKILVCMGLGFFLRRKDILNAQSVKGISALIVHVTAPCLLFSSIVSMDSSEFQNAVTLLWVGVVVYIVLIGLAILITKLMKIAPSLQGVYQATLIFGNVSFLGIPLAESLYGSLGVFYIAMLNIHFNLLFFSYGFYLIRRGAKTGARFSPKSLINSGIIGICLAMLVFFLQIPLPGVITEPITFVGSITSPLSMIVIGASAAAYSLKKVFSQKQLYILAVIRLLVYPIAAFFLFKLLLGDNLLTKILSIYIGMPTASVVGMTALAYDVDSESATNITVMTTILSLVTIPILYLVMS